MIDPSKDKFAYFKDNIQTAEDKEFDASQYYYHREDMTGKGGSSGMAGGPLSSVVGGMGALGGGVMSLGGGNGGMSALGLGTGLNLSAFHAMGGLGGGLDDGLAQQNVFGSSFHGNNMTAMNSFLGSGLNSNRIPLNSVGGMSVSNHELHRMNSEDPLASMMKGGRSFQLQTENKAPDMSEFPALGSRSSSWLLDTESLSSSSSRNSQSSEFVIQKEDFPALSPFGPNSNEKSQMQAGETDSKRHSSFTSSANDSMVSQRPNGGLGSGQDKSIGSSRGTGGFNGGVGFSLNVNPNTSNSTTNQLGGTGAFGQLHGASRPSNGVMTNGELDPNNQFGLLGMLHTVIRPSNDAKKNLMMGCDLTTLGLNLNATEPLHPIFSSPWAEGPLTKEPQFSLPNCYYNQPPALKTTHLSKFHLETLFFIFYSMPKDVLQAYAAQELYNRDWRYHSEQKMWLKRATPADSALFATTSVSTSGSSSSLSSNTSGGGSGTIGSIGSAVPSAPGSGSGTSTGPQFLYFDTTTWERRVFTGNIHSISTGLMGEEEIRVKFTNTTSS